MKRQARDWEKIFSNYVSDKGLISRVYEEFSMLKKKTTWYKWAKYLKIPFTKAKQVASLTKIRDWPFQTPARTWSNCVCQEPGTNVKQFKCLGKRFGNFLNRKIYTFRYSSSFSSRNYPKEVKIYLHTKRSVHCFICQSQIRNTPNFHQQKVQWKTTQLRKKQTMICTRTWMSLK